MSPSSESDSRSRSQEYISVIHYWDDAERQTLETIRLAEERLAEVRANRERAQRKAEA